MTQRKKHGDDSDAASPYTDPELRERLKAEITAGDRGGKPGQWSARKAQLLATEYEKAGGDYTSDKRTETQAHCMSGPRKNGPQRTADRRSGPAAPRGICPKQHGTS
jgi:hypothetical protein